MVTIKANNKALCSDLKGRHTTIQCHRDTTSILITSNSELNYAALKAAAKLNTSSVEDLFGFIQ